MNAFAGALLSTSCRLAPQLAKAHLELGNWAFNAATACHGEPRVSFTSEESEAIKWQIKVISLILLSPALVNEYAAKIQLITYSECMPISARIDVREFVASNSEIVQSSGHFT